MTSTASNQSYSYHSNLNPSLGTMYHYSNSPSEPGKFDFYRVHLNNHLSSQSNAPSLSTTSTKSRWTPFADLVSSEPSKSLITDSNVLPTTNNPIQPVASFPLLSNMVRNAMNLGDQSSASSLATRRRSSGTTLSSKDLNHLSPQSM